MLDEKLSFTADVWLYPGATPWHFVTLPKEVGEQLAFFAGPRRGFGSIRVQASIGDTVWKTSIFPDKSSGSFLLPLKADVRKRESIGAGDPVTVLLGLVE